MKLRFGMRGMGRALAPVLAFALLSLSAPMLAHAGDSRGGEPVDDTGKPGAPDDGVDAVQLPFRGWGLTDDFQLVKIFGNGSLYTVTPYANLSYLPWNTGTTYWDDGGLASDPWNPQYLYVSVPLDATLTLLYRFDIATSTVTYVAGYNSFSTSTGWNYALQGLGARCASRFADRVGGFAFYSHRRTHPVHLNYVSEITTTGAESTVLGPVSESRRGDNTQDFLNGAHWFTYGGPDANGNPVWGVAKLGSPPVVMGPNGSAEPTGILAYGAGSYYVSARGNQMYIVNTGTGTSGQLNYVPWGSSSFPHPPDLIDLSNVASYCRPVLP